MSELSDFKEYVQEQRQLCFGVELGGTSAVVGSLARQYDFLIETIETYQELEQPKLDSNQQEASFKAIKKIVIPQWIADSFKEYKYSWVSTVVTRIMADGRINEDGKKISDSDRELEKALCVAFVTGAYLVR